MWLAAHPRPPFIKGVGGGLGPLTASHDAICPLKGVPLKGAGKWFTPGSSLKGVRGCQNGTVHVSRAAEYPKAKGEFPRKVFAKFDPNSFVLVNHVAVFGRRRRVGPKWADDPKVRSRQPNLGLLWGEGLGVFPRRKRQSE
jgi:hypothetical protein